MKCSSYICKKNKYYFTIIIKPYLNLKFSLRQAITIDFYQIYHMSHNICNTKLQRSNVVHYTYRFQPNVPSSLYPCLSDSLPCCCCMRMEHHIKSWSTQTLGGGHRDGPAWNVRLSNKMPKPNNYIEQRKEEPLSCRLFVCKYDTHIRKKD